MAAAPPTSGPAPKVRPIPTAMPTRSEPLRPVRWPMLAARVSLASVGSAVAAQHRPLQLRWPEQIHPAAATRSHKLRAMPAATFRDTAAGLAERIRKIGLGVRSPKPPRDRGLNRRAVPFY